MPITGGYGTRSEVAGLSKAWRAQSYQEQEDDVAALVSSSHTLRAALLTIKGTVGSMQNALTGTALAEAEDGLAVMDGALHKMAETKFFDYQHSPGGTTADRFFDVAEICERVLMDLDIANILAMRQVNKGILAVIGGSTKLQRKLHLLPDLEAPRRGLEFHSELHFRRDEAEKMSNLRNLRIHVLPPGLYSRAYHKISRPTISMDFRHEDYAWLEPPGARIGNMLLCQPPVTVMDIEICCCGDMSNGEDDHVELELDDDGSSIDYEETRRRDRKFRIHGQTLSKVKNENGVTVGDIWDVCARLTREHELFPQAAQGAHDAGGWVMCNFNFDGVLPQEAVKAVQTVDTEPPLFPRSDTPKHNEKKRYAHKYLIRQYVSHKKTGEYN